MKRFKKIIATMLFLTIFGTLFINEKAQPVNAYFENITSLEDDFNSRTIDSTKWTSNNSETFIENYSLRFHPTKYEWVSQLMLEADNTKFQKSYVIEADLATNATRNAWQAFSFGIPDKNMKFSDAPFALIFFPSYLEDTSLTAFYANTEKSGFLEPINTFLYATPLDKANVFRRLKITVNLIDSKSSTVFYDILDTSGEYIKKHEEKDVLKVNAPLSGYIGLNNSGIETTFKHFKVYDLESNETIYEDDFSNSSIQYATEGEGVWTTSSFSKNDVVIGPLASLKLKGKDSSITSTSEFKKSQSDTIDCLFSTEVLLKYSSMTSNSVAGIEIGKASKNDNGYLFGIKKNENGFGFSLVIYDKNSNLLASLKSNTDAPGNEIRLSLKAYFDNRCVLSYNDLSLTVETNGVEGYVGLKNISIDSNECEGPYCDDFVMQKTIDSGCDATDVGINFNGTRETTLGQLKVKQFYICKNEWEYTKSQDFLLPTYEDTGIPGLTPNGYAIFDNSTNMTIFGTKQKYTNYVVRFDVQILTKTEYLKEYAGFGLEFGLDKYGTYYDNVQSVGLYNTFVDNNPVTLGTTKHSELTEGGDTKLFPIEGVEGKYHNFFDKRNGDYPTLNVVYVVKDGYVTMFFKYSDEPEEVLSKPRIVAKADNSTTGYCCVVGTSGISFTLDNFSLHNLDYVEKEEKYVDYQDSNYQITTRKDFRADNSDTSGLVLNNAYKVNKTIEINDGGSVKTKGLALNGLTRGRINSLEERTEFKYGDASIYLVNTENGKYIEGKDNNGLQKYKLSDNFQFANAFIEIERTNNEFVISACSGNKPLSSMGEEKATFYLNAGTSYSNIEIISSGLTRLSTFTFVNYDSHVNLVARNYNPETDAVISWYEKKSIQDLEKEKNKGCGGSLIGSSIIVTTICLAICALLIKRRRENN